MLKSLETENLATSENPKKSLWLKAVIWIAAILIAVLVIIGIGIYRLGWDGPAIRKIESFLPYPVAVVNWKIVRLSDFHDRFAAYQRAIEFNQAFDFSDPENAEIIAQQKQALSDRMIDLAVQEIWARRFGIKVTPEETGKELQQLKEQSGMEDQELDTVFANVYGWKRDEFVIHVVAPQIQERKLRLRANADQTYNNSAFQKAQEVLEKLKSGGDFTKLAAAFSDDLNTKDIGGDLGWAPKGYFVAEFERVMFKLTPGQVSELVVTEFGVHIIELLERTNNQDGTADLYHSRHILIGTRDFADWMAEKREQARIWRLPYISL